MMTADDPGSDLQQRFARPVLHLMFLVPMGGFILFGVLLGIFGRDRDSLAGWFVAGMLLMISLPLYWLIWRQRVRLTRQGISVIGPGCNVATNWENLASFYDRAGRAGLVTRAPMTGKGAERLRRYVEMPAYVGLSFDEAERRWLREGRYIPLRGFDPIVKAGKIQKAIARHLPDLPGLIPDPAAPVPAEGPGAPRLTASFWIVIGVTLFVVAILVMQPGRIQSRALSIMILILCLVGSFRMAIAAYLAWRARHRLLGFLNALLAALLALLSFAFL